MRNTQTKDLRVKLKPSDAADFQAAKQKAERELGFTMSDSEFAGRVVRLAVKEKSNDKG